MPIESDWFEGIIDDLLKRDELGRTIETRVVRRPTGEISHREVDIEVVDVERTVERLGYHLVRQGAPKGSRLEYMLDGRSVILRIGVNDVIAIYIKRSRLSAESGEDDLNDFVLTVNTLVHGHTIFPMVWRGRWEIAVYLHGDAEHIHREIDAYVAASPICRDARVVALSNDLRA